MYDETERREVARRAAARLQAGLAELTEAATAVEEATGIRLVRTRPHLFDARRPDLDRLRTQAQAWLLAMTVIDKWMPPGDPRTLGAAVKTMPRDELEALRRALRLAGALNDGPLP